MRANFVATCLGVAAVLVSCGQLNNWDYPKLDTSPVEDDYFGTKLLDEFRNLEDLDNPKVKKWLLEEEEFYASVIDNISRKDSLIKRFSEVLKTAEVRTDVPRGGGDKLFYKRKYVGKADRLFYRTISDNREEELFNVKGWAGLENSYNIGYYEPSFDGKYVAIGITKGGNEISTVYILDVDTKKFLKDKIPGCLHAFPNWLPDGSGFFYQQLRPLNTKQDTSKMYERSRVKFHKVGTSAIQDQEVFSFENNPDLDLVDIDFPFALTFQSSNKVLATVSRGTGNYDVLYINDLDKIVNSNTSSWEQIIKEENKVFDYVLVGNTLAMLSYETNSFGSIFKMELDGLNRKNEIYNSNTRILESMIQNKNAIYIKYLENGVSGLMKLNTSTFELEDVELPFQGTILLTSDWRSYVHTDDLYIEMESWVKERRIYRISDLGFALLDIQPGSRYGNPDDIVSKQVMVPSHDGELVPLSIVHREGIKLDGNNPVLLYAYGSYGTSILPYFDPTELVWIEHGGIYAVAHVRGGGEKGDAWYRAGYKNTKSNSWKDFIACSEYLHNQKYTSPMKLAVSGSSAGGITVGRAVTERPDLYKAAVLKVAVLNTIRSEYGRNTLNTTEYGSSKDSTEFPYLLKMDVYHHIQKEVDYPSMLITAGMEDTRVDAWMPAKVVAKLQANKNKNVVLFDITESGHFGGRNYAEKMGETYSFLLWQLGHPKFTYK